MSKANGKIWLLVTIIFAVSVTVYTLSDIVLCPWHAMPGLGGDGTKNEFAYLYQSIYGKGMWFDGMNFPYGDNIVFADGQPLLSVFFTCFKNVTPGIALTTLWLLIGLSYVLSIVYVYKILLHFKVAAPAAVVFACLIGIFSPQVFRIGGHYGLSYLCVTPMLFWWTILYHEQRLKKYCVYIFLLGLAITFLHPYFSALVAVWTLLYVAAYFIFIKADIKGKIVHVIPLLVSLVALFATVATVMHFTDPVKDRPVAPWGTLKYTTHINDIFTSFTSPIWLYVRDHHMLRDIFPYISDGGEGYTYTGLPVILTIIFSLVAGIVYKVRKRKDRLLVSSEGFSPIWLFLAFGALLFSMGVPYIWNMEWLLDYVSFVRQFRSLGRFSWIFYYIIAIYGVIVIYGFYARMVAKRRFVAGYSLLLLSIGIWAYEANANVQYIRNIAGNARNMYDMFFSTSEQNWESFLRQHHHSGNDFQAMVMLPFFHVGSDKLWVADTGWTAALTHACKASFQMHMPMVGQLMSRSSWLQTKKQVKTFAGPYADKPMLRDLKSNKPFLLLKYDADALDPDQEYLLQAADHIGHYSECNVYAFYPDRQAANDRANADSIYRIVSFMTAADTCVGCANSTYYIDHLDNGSAAEHFSGTGAMPTITGSDSIVAVVPVQPDTSDREYEFSCWFLLGDQDNKSPYINIQTLDGNGGLMETTDIFTKWSVDNKDMWFRASGYFRVKAGCRTIRCKVYDEQHKSYKVMDELQLRPAQATVISKAADGRVLVNNHLLGKVGGK